LCGSHNLATRGEQHAGSERAPAKVGKQGRRSDCSRRLTAGDAPARNWRRSARGCGSRCRRSRPSDMGMVTPKHADGRFIGAVVMLTGIGPGGLLRGRAGAVTGPKCVTGYQPPERARCQGTRHHPFRVNSRGGKSRVPHIRSRHPQPNKLDGVPRRPLDYAHGVAHSACADAPAPSPLRQLRVETLSAQMACEHELGEQTPKARGLP
jgi:hypothetical protein